MGLFTSVVYISGLRYDLLYLLIYIRKDNYFSYKKNGASSATTRL